MSTTITRDRYGRSLEEVRDLREKVETANAEAKARWNDPVWHKEMAAIITETILWGFEHENILNAISDVSYPGFNDRMTISEVRGLKAFWVARGGYIEASGMHRETFELPRDQIGFHVQEETDKVLVNFAETQADLINLGIQRLDAEVNLRFLRLLQAAVPIGNASYVSGSGLSLTALDAALLAVRDASRQRVVTIVGRETMTGQIITKLTANSTYPAFLPETNEEMIAKGILGQYRGAQIVTLINYLDANDYPFFPANELYVISKDASKCAFWGGLQSKEFEEPDNWYWHFLARKEFGAIVHRPERLRRIVDTNIDPNLGHL